MWAGIEGLVPLREAITSFSEKLKRAGKGKKKADPSSEAEGDEGFDMVD